MSRIVKFGIVFVFVIAGVSHGPRHACNLSSPVMMVLCLGAALVAYPLLASRSHKNWLFWTMAAIAPFVGIGFLFFYLEVLHWEHLPGWLVRGET